MPTDSKDVCLLGKTGSHWCTVEMTRMTHRGGTSIFMASFLRAGGLPGFDRLVSEGAVRRHLASAGRAVPQLHQRVGDRPAQLLNRFVGEDRSRASEPVDA